MKQLRFFFFLVSIFFISACAHDPNANQPDGKTENGSTLLSESAGEQLLAQNCITCHSKRYIAMQPAFPKKTWEKIVNKMVKNFGAPIPDSTAKQIIDYLVLTKGTHDSLSSTSVKVNN